VFATLLCRQPNSDPTPHSTAGARREAASVTSFTTIGKKTGERQGLGDFATATASTPRWLNFTTCPLSTRLERPLCSRFQAIFSSVSSGDVRQIRPEGTEEDIAGDRLRPRRG
jgi:hypothetical protein